MAEEELDQADVLAFLAAHHGRSIRDLVCLRGGYWSSAYSYTAGGRELVVRFGQLRDGYEMDELAARWAAPDLPIPEVLAVGEAFDGAFAISARHRGQFLEDVTPDAASAAGTALERLLAAFRAVPAPVSAPASWYPPGQDPATATWRQWLRDSLVDDPTRTVSGWRATLAADPALDDLYRRCEARVEELLQVCPERRDLVHSDLLHQNVLVSDDWSRITAVFSWKCSARGDFLFDVAWCTFWSGWTGELHERRRVAEHTAAILERGPR